MSKCYISFLGAGPYTKTEYYWPTDPLGLGYPTPYVQEAILNRLAPFLNQDRVGIFVTKAAYDHNYMAQIMRHQNERVLRPHTGLESRLAEFQRKGRIGRYEPILIPEGHDEAELWQIFKAVFDYLKEGDEIYFDITYGFRSLPMLGMVLLDYARVLKKCSLKAIYYGNYEAGRAQSQQEAEADPPRYLQAPIMNLLAFNTLQNWTHAARQFLQAGDASALADMIREGHPQLAIQLQAFTASIQTSRGLKLMRDIDYTALKDMVSISQTHALEAQLSPLIKQIAEKIQPFQQSDVYNGLEAVKWCIQHDLIQQGFTLLCETMISLVLDQHNILFHTHTEYLGYAFREKVGALLSKKNIENLDKIDQDDYVYKKLLQIDQWIKQHPNLQDIYRSLTKTEGYRNDINHAGFRVDYAQPEVLKQALKKIYEDYRDILIRYQLL